MAATEFSHQSTALRHTVLAVVAVEHISVARRHLLDRAVSVVGLLEETLAHQTPLQILAAAVVEARKAAVKTFFWAALAATAVQA